MPPWTPAEDAALSRGPVRSRAADHKRRLRLGIPNPAPGFIPWTADELEILPYYNSPWREYALMVLARRSPEAVRMKAWAVFRRPTKSNARLDPIGALSNHQPTKAPLL